MDPNHLSLDQQQPILCLNRLIDDLEYLYQDSQTADVIFLLENNKTNTTNGTSQHSSKNDGHDLASNGNSVTKNEEIALYAHRLILQAR